ncbi:MAG: prolyl oligopeptidase family serine peptidase [Chloroflexi bacterium]|nr:prolyl oligopeptidase family serine peptidase [Chloroflexota bacterium]
MQMHPDPLIQQVLDTWMPRFLNSDIAYYDILTTVARMRTWDDWGPQWMQTAAMHEQLAEQAWSAGRKISAINAFQVAAGYYHTGYHIYTRDMAVHEHGLRKMVELHDRMLPYMEPPVEKVTIPFENSHFVGLFSKPRGATKPPVCIFIPGLDSTKENRHRGRAPYLRRGMAVLTIDGPGQGEVSQWLTIRADYETVIGAAIDYLGARGDVDVERVGISGGSLGGYYAPRAAAFEKRIKACIGNCGPYDWAECFWIIPQVTREAFQHYTGAQSMDEAYERSKALTLKGAAAQIACPLLIVHGKLDPLIPWQQGERIVKEASGLKQFVLYDEGNHALNNISYKSGPRMADWMAEQLGGVVA